MGVINYETTEVVIDDLEKCMEGLDLIERELVIKLVAERLANEKRKTATNDLLGNVKLGDMIKRAIKERDVADEEEGRGGC